jgi:hypothetical protein
MPGTRSHDRVRLRLLYLHMEEGGIEENTVGKHAP